MRLAIKLSIALAIIFVGCTETVTEYVDVIQVDTLYTDSSRYEPQSDPLILYLARGCLNPMAVLEEDRL